MLACFALYATILVPSLGAHLLIGDGGLQAMPLAYAATCAAVSALAVLAVWLLTTRVDRRPFREVGLVVTSASLPALALGLLLSGAVVVLVNCPLAAAGLSRDIETTSWSQLAAALPSVLAAAFLLQGFPEELFFRGYVLSMFAARPVTAIAVSALVFGSLHLISGAGQQNVLERLIYLGPAAAFGLLAGSLVLLTRSLWSAVGVHAGFHVGSAVASVFGSGDGPANWIAQTVVYAAVAAVVLALARARLREPLVIDR